jgi:uncharacterized protein
MAAGSGKVALVRNSTALTGTCPNDPNIVDLAGYGSTANCFKGSAPAPAGSNTNAVLRVGNGCTNTRNNATDFAAGIPTPRNIESPGVVCGAVAFSRKDAKVQRKQLLCAFAPLRQNPLRGG